MGYLHGPFQLGTYAVFGFYVLSGYLMTYIMLNRYGYTISGRFKFAVNRFLRLYPCYWVAAVISLLLLCVDAEKVTEYKEVMFFPSTIYHWLRNFLLYFSFDSTPRLGPATWALTVELFYYFLICIGISRTKKLPLYGLRLGSCILWHYYFLIRITGRRDIFNSCSESSVFARSGYMLL